jgi:hypothetical protein
LGSPARNTEPVEGESEADEELPFATTLGNAVAIEGRYWVTAIDYRQKESHAVVAQIEQSVDRGTVVDLGRVYGDAEPPRIAVQGEQVIVVVPDSDASGRTLKIGRFSASGNRGRVEWFDSVLQGVDDSPVFSIATNRDAALVAWDEIDKATHHGVVRYRALVSASNGHTTPLPKPNAVMKGPVTSTVGPKVHSTSTDVDAEAPQLVTRAAGFWLGYLTSEVTPKQKRNSERLELDKAKVDEKLEDRPVVELGKRGLALLPLDPSGAASGQPVAVTAPGAHVVAFEVEAMPDGGALVAYRDDVSSPGVEGDVLEIAEVHPDGTVSRLRLEDERVGVGAPLLLATSTPKADEGVWVMVAGKSAEIQTTNYRWGNNRLSPLVGDPLLVGAEPLLREGAALLVARIRGRSVEFERLDCRFDVEPKSAVGK